MTDLPQYPLEQVILIKQRRFDEAVKTLEAKKALLEKAYEKLYDLTQELKVVEDHQAAKLQQLRDAMDQGEGIDKIQQMKSYMKVVVEQLQAKKKIVSDQQKIVDAAQKEVDKATDELFQRKKDLEKLEIHKKEWTKEAKYQVEQKEGVEHDEQGSATHQRIRREKGKGK